MAEKNANKWPTQTRANKQTDNNSLKNNIFKYYCFRTFLVLQSKFVPKGIPIRLEMAEKTGNKQTENTKKQTNRQ